MVFGGLSTKLKHVAEDADFASLHFFQHVDGRHHGNGVCVVGVVQYPKARRLFDVHSARRSGKCANAFREFFQPHMKRKPDRDGGKGVAHRMQAGGGHMCAGFVSFIAGSERNAVESLIQNVYSAEVAGFRKPEAECTGDGGEHIVVTVDNDGSASLHMREHFRFALEDAFARTEVFNMRNPDIRKNADLRLCHSREPPDLAKVIGAHLDDGDFVAFVQRKERQRNAGFVVLVAEGLHNVVARGQYGGDHLFCGRFADAPCKPHHWDRKQVAVPGRDGMQSAQSIFYKDIRFALQRLCAQNENGTLFSRVVDKFMSIKPLPDDGDIERAGRCDPAVDNDVRWNGIQKRGVPVIGTTAGRQNLSKLNRLHLILPP